MKEELLQTEKPKLLGASLVEVLLAVALFSILVIGVGGGLIAGNQSATMSGQHTRATFLADEAIEAIRSIKDADFSALAPGTYRLESSGNMWHLVATTPSSPETVEIYSRYIDVASIDANTVEATATVSWPRSAAKDTSVSLTTRFTNWVRASGTPCTGGMLAYSDISVLGDTIKYKLLDKNSCTWGSEQTVPSFGVPGNAQTYAVKLYASATRNEKILISKHVAASTTYIYGQVWNGSTWGNVTQLGTWNNANYPSVRDFDGDYLSDGTFLVAYDANGNTFRYQTWNGSAWSGSMNGRNLGGKPGYMVVRNQPGTTSAMLAVVTENNRVVTTRYSGGSWGTVTTHTTASVGTAYESVDFTWSQNTTTTGALIYTNAASDPTPNIRIWNGSAWSATVENQNIGANARAMTVTSQPSANEFLACFNDSANKITCLKSAFAPSWQTVTNGTITTSTDASAGRAFEALYESTAPSALSVYSGGPDNSLPKYRTYNPSTSAFSSEGSLSSVDTSVKSVTQVRDPNTNDQMVIVGTSGLALWTVGWDGTNGSFYSTGSLSQTEQSGNGSNAAAYWFDFAWNRY